jgi:hypothetical protein
MATMCVLVVREFDAKSIKMNRCGEQSFNKPEQEVFINFMVSGCLFEMGE